MQATMGGERYTSMAPTAIGKANARRWMAFEQGRLRRIGQPESVMGEQTEKCLAACHVHGHG